ncbi:hypothetical protein JTB14_004002 [Gonioctena quinquepunctata]|nr:hypothetical protein JTB14_004002 [Gonioctena quinquepunctata]
MPKMLDHCSKKHPDNIIFKNNQRLTVPNFTEPMNRGYFIIINVFDTLFRCTWDSSRQSNDIRFAVYHIGSPLIHKQYSFEISIISRCIDPEVITMRGPCLQMDSDSEIFMEEEYLSANYSWMKEFCDEYGDLHYSVTVLENIADK